MAITDRIKDICPEADVYWSGVENKRKGTDNFVRTKR